MPNYIVFKKVHSVLVKFATHKTILKKDKAKFNAALRKYLNTPCFYYVDELFICTDDISYCYCKILVVFAL